MPLTLKCVRCGATLLLHDAFAGATCRCRHCRTLIDVPVPPTSQPQRSHARPERPRLAAAAAGGAALLHPALPTHAASAAAAKAGAGSAAWSAAAFVKLALKPWVLGVAVFALVAGAGTYMAMHSGAAATGSTVERLPLSPAELALLDDAARQELADAERLARKLGMPSMAVALQTYVGLPLTAPRVAWVIDGSDEMIEYYNSVRSLTRSAMLQLRRRVQSYGVVLASEGGPLVQPIDVAGRDAYFAAKSMLEGFAPSGSPSLADAFVAAARQRPDMIFLVVARTPDRSEVRDISRRAVAVGTVTNVVMLGTAGGPVASLASATSGTATALTRDTLTDWTNLVASVSTITRLERDYSEESE